MNRNFFKIAIYMLALLSFAGCVKDENIFELKTLNTLSIQTATDAYSVTQSERLVIAPAVKESLPEGTVYKYEWKLSSTATGVEVKDTLISDKKDLDVAINVKSGNYYLRYYITDTKTGLVTIKQFTLAVNGFYNLGWMIASNKGEKGMVSFIREADQQLILNAPEAANGKTYGKAKGIYNAALLNMPEVLYFSDQGVFAFDANNFKLLRTTMDLFGRNMTFGTNPYYIQAPLESDQYIINNGNIYGTLGPYWYNIGFGEFYADLGTYSERFEGNYALFPLGMPQTTGSSTYFYDNNSKKFMLVTYGTRTINPTTGNSFNATSNPLGFNLAESTGKTMVGGDYLNGGEHVCVVKDNSNEYYIYTLRSNTSPFAGITQKIENSPDIQKSIAYATSTLYRHMYYAAENKIYLYDIINNSSRLVYTFPLGYQIKDLKMFKREGTRNVRSAADPMHNKRLVAAVNTGVAGEGEVYFLNLTLLGDIENNTFNKKYAGLGEIVNMKYRYP
ncbi:PKD-like family lipoprotein [Pedobacter steynii]|uniref:PKD-like family protein n=1 Tax=Pedobacter steynii TaxID=430522 RepID=A0A1D7QL32_9SPHI|nr:PKD-like family lipoprotein [Pedobacter steynii]AOM79357.1 hypothetical protein BFS30_20595 [Pedobacter steynii]